MAAKTFGAIDVQCKIMPAISSHLKSSLIQVEKPEILLDCLQIPIPRNIFDSVLRFPEIDQLFKVLQERKEARTAVKDGILPQYGEMNLSVRNVSGQNLNIVYQHLLEFVFLKCFLVFPSAII